MTNVVRTATVISTAAMDTTPTSVAESPRLVQQRTNHVLIAQTSSTTDTSTIPQPNAPALSHLNPTARELECTLAYGAAHTGHVA